MKNETAYLEKTGVITIKDSKMPIVGDNDVLIAIKHITICGSDSYFFQDPTFGGHFDDSVLPIVLGHECGGIVEKTGKNVTHLQKGDKVAVEPGNGCGVCHYCLEGRYNLCRKMNFMAAYPFERGALSRYISHPASMVFKIPDNMDTLEAALIEPLAVGMHAANRSGAKINSTTIVLGCGAIGLMTIASLKAMNVDNIIAVDILDNRLENAKNMGATSTINIDKKDGVKEILARTGELGANIVFETAGSPKTIAMTPFLVVPGGKIVTVGNIHGDTPFKFLETNEKEVDIISVFRYVNIYPMAIQSVSSGKIKIKDIVSKRFPFEEVQQAFESSIHEKDTVMKVAIEF